MPSLDSVILGYLKTSKVPGFYKRIVRNMLPNMSQIQKEEIYTILRDADEKRKTLAEKGDDLCRKYEYLADRAERDPDSLVREFEFEEKLYMEKGAKKSSGAALAAMKSAVKQKSKLQELKSQIGQ